MELKGKIALVTGASRGIGRGIAIALGKAGATVYITGRKTNSKSEFETVDLPSLEDTEKEITKHDGHGISVYCDHSNPDEVKKLFDRIEKEQDGQLDILVNNAYSAIGLLIECAEKKFWELDPLIWDDINNVGLRNHYICSVYAARLMVLRKSGLIVNISSAGGLRYLFNTAYGIGKAAVDRMAADCAFELRKHNVAVVSLWPGLVKTESLNKVALAGNEDIKRLRKVFGVKSESPEYIGKCIVYLATDPKVMKKSGYVLITRDLGDYYGFKDIDGKKPDNFRSVKTLLRYAGWTNMAACTPKFLKVPHWILNLAGSKL